MVALVGWTGALSLLAVVPAFSECFPVTSVAVLRYKGTDPTTGKFWSGFPTILVLVYSLPITTHLRPVDVYGKLQVVLIENVVLEFGRLVSSTSDFYLITSVHMNRLNDGRLVELSCLMMMCSFKNQVQVQLYLFSTFDINTLDHTKMNIALVGNAGHFRNKIDLPGSEGLEGDNITPQKMVSSSPFAG